MTTIEIKFQAKILRDFLKQNGSSITLTSCYQAIAKINGFKDWNTMSAHINTQCANEKSTQYDVVPGEDSA